MLLKPKHDKALTYGRYNRVWSEIPELIELTKEKPEEGQYQYIRNLKSFFTGIGFSETISSTNNYIIYSRNVSYHIIDDKFECATQILSFTYSWDKEAVVNTSITLNETPDRRATELKARNFPNITIQSFVDELLKLQELLTDNKMEEVMSTTIWSNPLTP